MTLLLHVRESLIHWYASTLDTVLCAVTSCSYTDIDVPVYMHWLSSPVTWIMEYLMNHGYSCILVILIIVYVTWIIVIVTWVFRPVFLLHDYVPFWDWYSRYWTCELLICDVWNPTSIVPVSLYPILCYQLSSGPVIMLHVPCTVLVLVTLCSLNEI